MERKYYDSKEIASLSGMSLRWVIVNRNRIVGRQRFGRLWRFEKAVVDARIARNKSLLEI